jgi:glycosyltransferase involved in cell wall biosynthesis
MSANTPRRLCFVVNHGAFFTSHRLPIAEAAMKAGWQVTLVTGQAGSVQMEKQAVERIAGAGIAHTRTCFRSDGVNPIRELFGLLQLTFYLIRTRPDVVHCVSPKGVLYGGIASRLAGIRGVVLAVSGMGYAFTEDKTKSFTRYVIAFVYRALARFAFGHENRRVIVQNIDDREALLRAGFVKAHQLILIPGSGVDLSSFQGIRIEEKSRLVIFPARMLRDKGVYEYVEAVRHIKSRVPDWRFVLAGAADYHNPTSVSQAQIEQWQQEGLIEWLGHVENMVSYFADASIVCLPSYREGMPKALLEAAAAGCAVITTDSVGCKEAIIPGSTGDLVPVRDVDKLTTALYELISDRDRREAYGKAGMQLANSRFGIDLVICRTLNIYLELLNDG